MKVQIKELIIESEKDFSTVLIQIGENGEIQYTKPVFEMPKETPVEGPLPTEPKLDIPEGFELPKSDVQVPSAPDVTKTREAKELPPEMQDMEF